MNYFEIRKYQKEVNTHVIQQSINDKRYISKCAECIGLKTKGNNIYFDSESEKDAYWDFMMYERINNYSSLFESAKSSIEMDENERSFLSKIIIFPTAMYHIEKTDGDIVWITNNETDEQYGLTDINLSKGNIVNALLFFRLLKIDDYYLTSGFSFIFMHNIPVILKQQKLYTIKEYMINKDITRFRAMLKLNRRYGIDVKYKDV